MRRFKYHWLDGKTEELEGENSADAMWETHRIGENHEEQFDLEVMNIYATAIRKQIMDELWGWER